MELKIKEEIGENRNRIKEFYRKMDNWKEIKTIINHYDKKVIQKTFFLKEIEKKEKLINRKLDIWKY